MNIVIIRNYTKVPVIWVVMELTAKDYGKNTGPRVWILGLSLISQSFS